MDVNFSKIEQEYLPNINDNDEMLSLKTKFFNLTESERRILMIYLDEETYTGTAKFFGVSAPTVKKYIKKIIEKLK